MAAFVDLDWRRIDVTAIVTFGGLATIDERRHPACRDWLARQGYGLATFDCRPGLSHPRKVMHGAAGDGKRGRSFASEAGRLGWGPIRGGPPR